MKYNFLKLPFLLSIIFLALSCFVFFFMYIKINDNNNLSVQMLSSWQDETHKTQDIKFLISLLKITETERTLLDTHFIRSSNVVPFLDMIGNLSTQVNAQTEVLLVDTSKSDSGLEVDLKTSGSFEAIYKFITLLENSSYEMDITFVDIQNSPLVDKNGKTTSVWSAILKVKLLSFFE